MMCVIVGGVIGALGLLFGVGALAYRWGHEDGYMERYQEELEKEIQENDEFRWLR